MTQTIAVLSMIPRLSYHLRSQLPNLRISNVSPGQVDTLSKLNEAEILIADCDLLIPYANKLTSIKWIQATWAGLDKFIPHVQNTRRDYILTRFSGESFGLAMSEYVIAQIVNYERDQRQQYENQRLAEWKQEGRLINHRFIHDLTIGILGIGTIGKSVAEKLKLFGASIWGMTRTVPKEKLPYLDEHRTVDNLPDILKNCDYIINVLPSTQDTIGLLNGNVLEHCKSKNAVFMNIGRGSVIKETDLINALEQKWISAAILDVFEKEPLPKESKLWSLLQVTISPHNSGITTAHNVAKLFAANYARYVNGESMINVFDFNKGY
ncbi:PREDICTED: probable 2-ketogluconate reductase isoform X2 [Acromyrmex echinatior]|uniref:Glyoxylate/hydroxypyruvate reductase A n=1 Tax=Acromyrmex echinatior TaxID=103372 RepID=F4X5G7_ACREC|nr:PREDICTED: probable 2-ketogluconate reductase isoform X2 [Acromyrmex echinatior]EGI58323.1 Glyoxylate/hydroxypyruvate reductase A [Acromyrmex echinatior]